MARRLWRRCHNRRNGNRQRNKRGYLDNLVRRNAECAVVIGLPGRVTVGNLNQAHHEHENDARYPEQG